MKKNLPIIVGISLPILILLLIVGFAYFPNISIKPNYNFVFTFNPQDRYNYNSNIYYENEFKVLNGKLTRIPVQRAEFDRNGNPIVPGVTEVFTGKMEKEPKLYLYNVKDDSLKEISFEQAEKFEYDPGPTSSDGYVVDFGNRRDYSIANEIFGGTNRNFNAYILKGNKAKGIHLTNINKDAYSFYDKRNIKFIGWIN